ncbi:hypothetical protein CCP4SC76_1980005 [Gammaproteobacteria bacterium]
MSARRLGAAIQYRRDRLELHHTSGCEKTAIHTDSQQAFLKTVSDNNGLAIIAMDVGDVEKAIMAFQKS